MRKLIFALILLVAFISRGYAQQTTASDSNTKYFDENGVELTAVAFNALLEKGGWLAEPVMKEGKIASIKLKKSSEDSSDEGHSAEAGSPKQKMLTPDEQTEYLDEHGKKIDKMTLFSKVQSGDYTFEPEFANERVKSIKLKKSSNAIIKGAVAKEFSIKDIKGKNWSLQELKGKIVVLNFWFIACIPCRKEMPELNALVDKYKNNDDVVFLAVTHDNKESVQKFLSKKAFKFNIVADQAAMITDYNIKAFPTTLIIGKDSKIAFSLSSYSENSVPKIEEQIKMILNN